MNIQRSLYCLSNTIKQYQVGNKKDCSYKDILVYLYKTNLFLYDDEDFNNGEMNPTQLDNYFQKLSEKISNEINYVDIMYELCDEIDCEDNLYNYIDGNIDVTQYTQVINPTLQGEQQYVPKGNVTKIKIDRIKKTQINKLKEDDIKGKEEIEENVKEIINKTAELAKSKRGLPFLALLMRVCKNKPENLKILLETDTDLIKKVLEHEISQIYLNYILKLQHLQFLSH